MVFFLVAIAAVLIAAAIALGVELFRLVHVPWLTTADALLVGRIFSLWDMLA
jgi:hypothetical protein